ncbi:hypothetical protein FB451DRAFT_1405514 [Mycena latifolia]|nr:hypothetical protein FB451DRAFT_1405514 [Mycena latifolia]
MAEAIGTVASILQLVDTALKAQEYLKDFHDAPKEQQQLFSEMGHLKSLLVLLEKRSTGNLSSEAVEPMSGPLSTFKRTMEHLAEKLGTLDGRSKFTQRLTCSVLRVGSGLKAQAWVGSKHCHRGSGRAWVAAKKGDGDGTHIVHSPPGPYRKNFLKPDSGSGENGGPDPGPRVGRVGPGPGLGLEPDPGKHYSPGLFEAAGYLEELERIKTLINLWLSMDIWDVGQKQMSNQDRILNVIREQRDNMDAEKR